MVQIMAHSARTFLTPRNRNWRKPRAVSAAPLPLTSLADDVAALNRSLDRTEGPIVLAGHAYAGAVIALAAANVSRPWST